MTAQEKKSIIYLTGFMGSGKSTIAPILANTIGYKFLDIDKAVEQETGKNVIDIFLDEGETYFREIEERIVRATSLDDHIVVSLGGGTITSAANLSLVKSSGVLIYLKTDLQHIFQRVKHRRDRPLLLSKDGERLTDDELLKRIEVMFSVREPLYSQADIIVETSDKRVGVTVDRIVKMITPLVD